jgi:hypothetical protein
MFIQRNFNYKEIDDFNLHVKKHLLGGMIAVSQYDDGGIMLGWKLRYE